MLDKWKGPVGDEKVFLAHLTDICKEFDCLYHELIIAKLNAYGFSFPALLFMIIYLTGNKELLLIMISLHGKKFYLEYLKVLCLFFAMKETDFTNFAHAQEPTEKLYKWFCDNLIKGSSGKFHLILSTNKPGRMGESLIESTNRENYLV